MTARSDLVDVRPFRTGLAVLFVGLMLTLGAAHGGYLGAALGDALGLAIGGTGVVIVGALALLAGVLLLTGASAGAILRRSGRAVHKAARRSFQRPVPALRVIQGAGAAAAPKPLKPPVDVVDEFPELVSELEHQPLLVPEREEPEPDQESLFDVTAAPAPDYRLPDRELLRTSPPGGGANADQIARIADALVQTLANFGVEATVVGRISGPRVTRYELQLAPGTKVAKVASLKDDLSYALATTEIRILAPIPGKQAVGVELPNATPNLVTLGDIFEDLPQSSSPLAVWLGKDISGQAVWTDLARMPHMLIAGTTGSGKSGCINTILTSVLLRSSPDEVRMILIDPKRIELGYYESIPHLLTPVVSSPKEAAAVLRNVVAEMERRYERLSAVRARSLPEANRALRSRGEAQLPYLLVVIDELADLMMISPQEVEDARHPPRPEVARGRDPPRARDAAAVRGRDHRDDQGERAEPDRLRGLQPDRLARDSRPGRRREPPRPGRHALQAARHLAPPARPGRVRERGGDRARRRAVPRAARAGARRDAARGARGRSWTRTDGGDGEFDPDEDPLLERAIEIVVQTQTASVSLIQRRLRVGYTRAGRLIDMLERRGIISGFEGSKPRRVLVGEAELERVHAS